MLMVSCSGFYDEKNIFRLKEIFVSDDAEMYVLKKDESFFPSRYSGNVKEFYDSVKNNYYPNVFFSEPRVYDDNDPKSLAVFFMNKIQDFNLSHEGAEKKLFDVVSGFGKEMT